MLTKINGKYELWLPEHRAVRPEWATGWEYERIEAMMQAIKSTDIVFDIGTEEGDISALLVKYTGCDIVLFEPNDRVWSCIKAIWEGNELKEWIRFFPGFLSNINQTKLQADVAASLIPGIGEKLIPEHGFKQLYENYPDVPQVTMDNFCEYTGIYPTVITMDVEGSEFEVMKGAEKTLREKRPMIFMSVHAEFMSIHYNQHSGDMFNFIHGCGYTHKLIAYDHELHVQFIPK